MCVSVCMCVCVCECVCVCVCVSVRVCVCGCMCVCTYVTQVYVSVLQTTMLHERTRVHTYVLAPETVIEHKIQNASIMATAYMYSTECEWI